MAAIDTLAALRKDPQFRKLSYLEQQQLVKLTYDKEFTTNPELKALPPGQQMALYQTVMAQRVQGWTPTLNAFEGTLTDQERLALDQTPLGNIPGTQDSYKRALRLGERIDAGDLKAIDEASDWIVRNRAGTNSLLVQIAAGAKDAVEVMFGQDDQMFNDLRLNVKDYNKLSDYLLSKMPGSTQQTTSTKAALAGMAAGMAETTLLTAFGVGTLRHPGLFTKGIWSQVAKQRGAALLSGEMVKWSTTTPFLVEGIGSGVVDLARSFPKLIETQQIDGNGAFWKQAAQVFGEGVAYDVIFNSLQNIWRLAVKPSVKMLKKANITDQKMVRDVADTIAFVDPENWGPAFSRILKSEIPEDLLQRLPTSERKTLVQAFQRFDALQSTKVFSPDTPEGFRFLAKAMNMDVEEVSGKIRLLNSKGHVSKVFNTRKEAVSWAQSKLWKGLPDIDEEADVLLGAQRDIRIRKFVRTDRSIDKIPTKQRIHMVGTLGADGGVDFETTSSAIDSLWRTRRKGKGLPDSLKYESVTEQDWLKDHLTRGPDGYVHYRQQVWPNPEFNTVKIPQTMSNSTRDTFLRYMDDIIRRGDVNEPSLMASFTTLSDQGLDTAAKNLDPGASVVHQGNKWTYKVPGRPEMNFFDQGSINRQIFQDLYSSGRLTEPEVIDLFKRSTGYSIKVSEDDVTGLTSYLVWDKRGRLVDRADSIQTLLNKSYEYELKLPDFMVPDILVRQGNLQVGQTLAMGNTTDLYKFLDDFVSLARKPAEAITIPLANGQNAKMALDPDNFDVVVEIPSLRYHTTFGSEKQAQEFLKKIGTSAEGLRKIAYDKGFRVDTLPSGSLVFHDSGNNGTVTHSVKEAMDFLASKPSRDTLGAELASGLPQEALDSLQRSVRQALGSQGVFDAKSQYTMPKRFKISGAAWIDRVAAPFMSWAERTAQRTGHGELIDTVKKAVTRRRMVSIETQKSGQVIRQLLTDPTTGKLIPKAKRLTFATMLEHEPENWDKLATSAASLNGVLSESDRRMLLGIREYYRALGTKFNVDFLGFFTNYVPHARDRASLEDLIETLKKPESRAVVLAKMFRPNYKNIPAVEFLSRNGRLDEFINIHNRKDIAELMTYYTEKGYREMYLKQPIEDIKNLTKSLEGQLEKEEIARLVNFGAAMAGETPDDPISNAIRSGSLWVSERIVKGFEYLSELSGGDSKPVGKAFLKMAEASVTDNVLADLSANVSVATLGFRPMRILSNLGQSMNTYAAYGHWFFDASRDVTDEYVQKLFKKGIINERIFAATADGMEHVKNTVADMGMMWQQNSEYYTRALTARSAELAFDDALPKLVSGQLNFQGFLDLAGFTFLDASSQNEMYQMLLKGQIDAAKDIAMMDSVRILMFDYAKENLPGAFQGTLGRLYGKFGVFKVGQVDMYRRFLKSSNTSQGKQRLIRLAAGSFVVYNAFQAAGIDYNGFTLQDPLDLTGGPVWETLVDISRSTGSGPEAQLAKSNLWRNLTPALKMQNGRIVMGGRLWIPGALQINSLLKSWDTLSNGDYYGAFLDGLSAPRNTEPFDLMEWLD